MSDVGVPSGWRMARLADIAEIQGGIQKQPRRAPKKNKYPFLRVANVLRGQLDLDEVHEVELFGRELDTLRLQRGDLLIVEGNGSRAHIGRMAVWNGTIKDCVHQNHIIRARLKPGLLPTLAEAYWNSPEGNAQVLAVASSTTGLYTLSVSKVGDIRLPIPPPDCQRALVDEIEKHLSRIDAGVAALQRVQANLKRYRASVLKAACEGRLVPTEAELARQEGRGYEPASVLLKRILVERRQRWEQAELAKLKAKGKPPQNDAWKKKYEEPKPPDSSDLPELPEGWCWATVGALISGIETGKSFRCDERPPSEGEVGVVKVSAVTWGTYDEEESKTCTEASKISAGLFVKNGDFLFSRANTIDLVGACVIADRVTKRVMLSDKILRLRPVAGVDPWLLRCLRSTWGRSEIERLATGNQESMRNIGQDRLCAIRLPLAPADEMRRIVVDSEACASAADELDTALRANRARASSLRQSILRAAFSGELLREDTG